MSYCIHYSWAMPKQLEGLRRAGRKAELAATKCQAILDDLRMHGCRCEAVLNQRTRKGEWRIKNCVKYDLGSGYRLVTIKGDGHLFVTFVGSHDDTDQWIDHHRYDNFVPSKTLYRCEERVAPADPAETNQLEPAEDKAVDDYEAQLIARLDEAQLKSIFQGLFMSSPSTAEKGDVRAVKGAAATVHCTPAVR
jgi:hypothetical protein